MLGVRASRAQRAVDVFRTYDTKLFHKLRPLWNDDEGFISASRQAQATLERLLAADRENVAAQLDDDDDDGVSRFPLPDVTGAW